MQREARLSVKKYLNCTFISLSDRILQMTILQLIKNIYIYEYYISSFVDQFWTYE